jgi:hypothetical protein
MASRTQLLGVRWLGGAPTWRSQKASILAKSSSRSSIPRLVPARSLWKSSLVEVIDLIYRRLTERWRAQGHGEEKVEALWNDYVPSHLLPRLHGYELLMAPYAIAHLKIGLKLYETGYRFRSNERARIYLTNALEPASLLADAKAAGLFEALGHEAQAVNDIKRQKCFTVVIGNPPYSLWSQNLGESLRAIVNPYPFVNGELIKERGALQFEKILQDDYVKFFRLSQVQIEKSKCGIIGLITNHAFMDNPTLRGRLMEMSQVTTVGGALEAPARSGAAPWASRCARRFVLSRW